jgi:chaperonin GroES
MLRRRFALTEKQFPRCPECGVFFDSLRSTAGNHLRTSLHFPGNESLISKPGPLGDHILVRPFDAVKTAGGMIIADTQAERPGEGIVLAIGPGRVTDNGILIPPDVRPGDHVLFPTYAGQDKKIILSVDGQLEESLLVMRQDELIYNRGPYQPTERSSDTNE